MKSHPERMFCFRLARELGMTVSRMLLEMDSRELTEWMAFFTIEQEEREGKKKLNPKELSDKLKATLRIADGPKGR